MLLDAALACQLSPSAIMRTSSNRSNTSGGGCSRAIITVASEYLHKFLQAAYAAHAWPQDRPAEAQSLFVGMGKTTRQAA